MIKIKRSIALNNLYHFCELLDKQDEYDIPGIIKFAYVFGSILTNKADIGDIDLFAEYDRIDDRVKRLWKIYPYYDIRANPTYHLRKFIRDKRKNINPFFTYNVFEYSQYKSIILNKNKIIKVWEKGLNWTEVISSIEKNPSKELTVKWKPLNHELQGIHKTQEIITLDCLVY